MSLVPTIGNIGWATLNTGRALPVVLEPVVPLAQPASAARPPTALADNTFLRSIICLLVGVDAAARCRLHWHHDLALLVLRFFCVLAPLGGRRGDRVG